MRKMYLILTALLILAVALQFYSAAMGAFTQPRDEDTFALHQPVGHMTIALSVLATIAAALARAAGKLIGITALVAALATLQLLLEPIANGIGGSDGSATTTTASIVFGVHGINALIIAGLVCFIFIRARRLATRPRARQPVGPHEPAPAA